MAPGDTWTWSAGAGRQRGTEKLRPHMQQPWEADPFSRRLTSQAQGFRVWGALGSHLAQVWFYTDEKTEA